MAKVIAARLFVVTQCLYFPPGATASPTQPTTTDDDFDDDYIYVTAGPTNSPTQSTTTTDDDYVYVTSGPTDSPTQSSTPIPTPGPTTTTDDDDDVAADDDGVTPGPTDSPTATPLLSTTTTMTTTPAPSPPAVTPTPTESPTSLPASSTTSNPGPSAGGDPLTVYRGQKTWFNLPVGILVPILLTPELCLYARTFSNHRNEQWFDLFFATGPVGEPIIDVRIRQHIDLLNYSSASTQAVQTLSVKLSDTMTPVALRSGPASAYHLHGGRFRVVVDRLKSLMPIDAGSFQMIGKAFRECAVLDAPSMQIKFCSSPATEYVNTIESVKFAHLDMFMDFKENGFEYSCAGLLPEIWGVRKMSEATRAMLAGSPGSPTHRAVESSQVTLPVTLL